MHSVANSCNLNSGERAKLLQILTANQFGNERALTEALRQTGLVLTSSEQKSIANGYFRVINQAVAKDKRKPFG